MRKEIKTNPAAVLALLRSGSENGVSLAEVCRRTGLSPREARKTVETLRRGGKIICSGRDGYYFPAETVELRKYVQQMERTAKSIFYTLKGARQALREIEDGET